MDYGTRSWLDRLDYCLSRKDMLLHFLAAPTEVEKASALPPKLLLAFCSSIAPIGKSALKFPTLPLSVSFVLRFGFPSIRRRQQRHNGVLVQAYGMFIQAASRGSSGMADSRRILSAGHGWILRCVKDLHVYSRSSQPVCPSWEVG